MACLAQTVEVLRPFSQAMEALEGDQYPTLSLVNLLFNGITATLMKLAPQATRPVRNLIVHLQQQLQERENISEIRDLRSMLPCSTRARRMTSRSITGECLPQFVRGSRS